MAGNSQHTAMVADKFDYKMGDLPRKYLGIPIDKDKLSKERLTEPATKVEKRLETW